MTVKAPQLEAALELAQVERVGDATVVPLLNGVDHVPVLRAQYENVLAASIVVESERIEPGLVRHLRGTRVALAPGERRDAIADELRATGLDVAYAPDDATVLWGKLALIAPLALTTTALGAPVGTVEATRMGLSARALPRRERCGRAGFWREPRFTGSSAASSSSPEPTSHSMRRISMRAASSSWPRSRTLRARRRSLELRRRRRRSSSRSSRRDCRTGDQPRDDQRSARTLAASPWVFGFADEGANVWAPFLVVGLAAIFLGLTTKQQGGYSYRRHDTSTPTAASR